MTHNVSVATKLPASAMLAAYKERINEALVRFFASVPDVLGVELSAVSLDALEKLREYTMRPSKRIRGSLGAAAYDHAAEAHFGEAGIALGVALELVQSYLLIVDDVMDKSDLRRGEPTVHRLYAQEADEFGDLHEAGMLAINVGLVGQHLANVALLAASEEPERVRKALLRLHVNITATGFGQIDDLYQLAGRTVTSHDVVRKYRLKSSHYTFINPLQAGLALAGVSDGAIYRRVALFGEAAGVAFQLHDDFLGIFGDASDTGKLNVDDLQEGKYTMLVQYALEHAPTEEANELRRMLGSESVGQTELDRARGIFERSGARAFTQAEALRYAAAAKRRLGKIGVWDDSFKAFLAYLVDYSVSRRA